MIDLPDDHCNAAGGDSTRDWQSSTQLGLETTSPSTVPN